MSESQIAVALIVGALLLIALGDKATSIFLRVTYGVLALGAVAVLVSYIVVPR